MPRRPMRPMRPIGPTASRTVTVTRSPDLAGVSVRRGTDVLGHVARMGAGTEEWLTGTFAHTPAFSDAAELFQRRAAALAAGDTAAAEALSAEIERLDIHIHHGGHDMRIDQPGTLSIDKGQVRFRASPAFQTLRNGGL